MEDGSFEETVVVRYLLGDLPEEAQIQVEDRAFSDPEYLRLIEAVEADLIDSYVQGEIQGAERRQFEGHFLASPERRKKIEFARALAHVAGESQPARDVAKAAPPSVTRHSWRETLAQLLGGRTPAFQFAMAGVAVVLLAVMSWQLVQTGRLRGQLSQLEANQRLQQQREQALQQAANEEHARAEDLAAQLRDHQGGAVAPVASLMLLPGIPRSEGALPQLAIPDSAQLARIQIQLEPVDDFPQFRVELRTHSGEEVLTRSNLRAQRSRNGRAVVLELPASILSPGDYELTLQGATSGETKDIGFFNFSVAAKH